MASEWFFTVQNEIHGPFTSAEVGEQIAKGVVGLAHWIWKQGMPTFERISTLKDFEHLLPTKPAHEVLTHLQAKLEAQTPKAVPPPLPQKPEQTKHWFVVVNGNQSGPFSKDDLLTMAQSKQITGETFGWKPGMANWGALAQIPEISAIFSGPALPPPTPQIAPPPLTAAPPQPTAQNTGGGGMEKRKAPRKPLKARIMLANNEGIAVALCQDVSSGGMFLITSTIPGPVGTQVKINVTPEEADVPQFTAEGEIVRILPDSRGFSVKFTRISEDTKNAIQKYIKLVEGS